MSKDDGRKKTPMEEHFSPEIFHAIGLLLMTCSMCEAALSIVLCRLIAHPNLLEPSHFVVVWRKETRVKLENIKALSSLRLRPEGHLELCRLSKKIENVFP